MFGPYPLNDNCRRTILDYVISYGQAWRIEIIRARRTMINLTYIDLPNLFTKKCHFSLNGQTRTACFFPGLFGLSLLADPLHLPEHAVCTGVPYDVLSQVGPHAKRHSRSPHFHHVCRRLRDNGPKQFRSNVQRKHPTDIFGFDYLVLEVALELPRKRGLMG